MAAGTYIGAASLVLFAAVANYFKDFSSIQNRTNLSGQSVLEDSAAGNRTRYTFIHTNQGESTHLTLQRLIRPQTPGYFEEKSGSEPFYALENQEECWKVLSGRLMLWMESRGEFQLSPGDKPICVPAGETHTFWNPNNATALDVETTMTPAGQSERFYRTYCGLGADAGSVDLVSPLQLMVSLNAAHMRLAVIPKLLWIICQYTLIPGLQYLAGYTPFYPEYTQ